MLAAVILLVGLVAVDAFGYGIHRLLHCTWAGPLYVAHMAHYLELYPPGDFSSETYRGAGGRSTVLLFLPFALAAAGLAFWALPAWLAAGLCFEMAAAGWLNDRMHDSFHIARHPFGRWAWYRRLRRMHRVHHEAMGYNFGIVSFAWDRVVGTLRAVPPPGAGSPA